MEQLEQKLSDL